MRFRILAIVVAGVVLLVLAERYGPGGVQRRGMRAMNEIRRRVEPALAADPRFKDVRMTVSTHPGLVVRGEVADAKALDDLRAAVAAAPGVPADGMSRVIWRVEVQGGPATTSSEP
jgi:hypothetical protein